MCAPKLQLSFSVHGPVGHNVTCTALLPCVETAKGSAKGATGSGLACVTGEICLEPCEGPVAKESTSTRNTDIDMAIDIDINANVDVDLDGPLKRVNEFDICADFFSGAAPLFYIPFGSRQGQNEK